MSTIEAQKGPLFLCVFCGGGRCDRDRSSVNDTDYCVDCSIDQSRVRCTVTRSTMETNNSLVTPCYCQCRLQTFQSSCDAHCRALSNCCAYKIHTKNRKENLQKKKTKLASCCRPKLREGRERDPSGDVCLNRIRSRRRRRRRRNRPVPRHHHLRSLIGLS